MRVCDSISDAVWWAFVTLTTVGYGDRVPATLAGRAIGIGLAFAGVVLAALLTGRIASAWVERSLREGRGMTDQSKQKNHFVICGWKAALDALLRDLVAIDASLRSDQFLLVASVDPGKVEAVRTQADFRQLHFVRGDPLEEAVLTRANVRYARRILVLADDTGSHSAAEADARTVMTVITVAKLAPDAYICAELLDPKYQQQLEAAGADEMILTQHNSRVLLANAAVGTGISGIFYALMTGESGGGLVTESFSPEFVGARSVGYVSTTSTPTARFWSGWSRTPGMSSTASTRPCAKRSARPISLSWWRISARSRTWSRTCRC